jgi:hypothetical protein
MIGIPMLVLLLAAIGAIAAGYCLMVLSENQAFRRFSIRHPILVPLVTGALFLVIITLVSVGYTSEARGGSRLNLGFILGGSFYVLGVLVPVAIILRRLGYSGWWAALGFIPIVQVVGLWLLAVRRWPTKTVADQDCVGPLAECDTRHR